MLDVGNVFIAVVIIVSFAAFIVWARSATGQSSLRKSGRGGGLPRHRGKLARRKAPPDISRPTRTTKHSSR